MTKTYFKRQLMISIKPQLAMLVGPFCRKRYVQISVEKTLCVTNRKVTP